MWRRRAIIGQGGAVAGPRHAGVIPAAVMLLGIVAPGVASAQSTTWDALLSNSNWYVREENLLAYTTSGTSFTDPAPVACSDQTVWDLGTATNGLFTGTAVATLRYPSNPQVAITNTTSIVSGIVTDAGQIRMKFISESSGSETIGIGQMRTLSGTTYMEMQMIIGNSAVFTTHWAYMAPYDPDTFTPPSLFPEGTLLSPEWRWTEGTTWAIQSDELFGEAGTGTFSVTDYSNGYFWGPGAGPPTTAAKTFTHIGSMTPEGNVLFNVLIGGTMTSLAGQITGTGLAGRMALRSYDGTNFGPEAIATVVAVPEPSTVALSAVATAAWAAAWAAGRRRPRRRSRSDRLSRAGTQAA